MLPSNYRGRFAPSPTGPLHFGSLVAAVGSYLDAKHLNGTWLVRMEDLDAPRCVPGAADDILRTLEAFGLHSDESIIYQSQRTAAYEEALQQLQAIGAVYPCACTRKEIADSALHGIDGQIYPGTCRNGVAPGRKRRAWRVRTDLAPSPLTGEGWGEGDNQPPPLPPSPSPARGEGCQPNAVIKFTDTLQGSLTQHLENEIGDFVVKRADGLFAYQLAAVADDAFQGITHVVRGADLLASTPRQIYLQRLLGLPTPAYMHLPIAVNNANEKLSKQTLAAPVDVKNPVATLLRALDFLQQQTPAELGDYNLKTVLDWAIKNWDVKQLSGMRTLPAAPSTATSHE